MTHVFVLPVSGGHFPHQLAAIEWLADAGTAPDLALGSSGGNIAAYLAAAGGWSPTGMHAVIDQMYSGLFVKSWWPPYLAYMPSVIKGYFKGSVYDTNPEFLRVFASLFGGAAGDAALERTEIWSGTFNISLSATHLFCNRTAADAALRPDAMAQSLLNVEQYTYVGPDRETLARVCIASAAIPAVFPPQEILGQRHVDGGTSFTSPLSPMQASLRAHLGDGSFHITYLSSYNVQDTMTYKVCYDASLKTMLRREPEDVSYDTEAVDCAPGSIYTQGFDAVREVMKSQALQDRKAGVDLLGAPADVQYTERIVTHDEFVAFERARAAYKRSFVETYPLSTDHIAISAFTPADIRRVMAASQHALGLRCWYVA